MANENRLEEVISTSLEKIRSMVDANTVIGTPISTENGVTVIPVSKVSVGYASGGLDFNGKDKPANNPQNFGAGGGTGVSVVPVGFLIIKSSGSVEMINVGQSAGSAANDPIEQIISLIEKCPELIGRVKSVFKKKDTSKSDDFQIIIEEEVETAEQSGQDAE